MNMIQSNQSGNKDNKSDNPIIGIIAPMMLYFFKIFKVWITKCDLVNPTNAIGFILNPFKYIVLIDLGMAEYKNIPASPVRLIKTLPVFPNFVINLVAVSRYFMLRILERIAVVRGMLQEFLIGYLISLSNFSIAFMESLSISSR